MPANLNTIKDKRVQSGKRILSGRFTNRTVPRLYRRWVTMRSRCLNPKFDRYKWYGGRGINICKRWLNFFNFEADMLPSFKEGLTLERRDVNGDYTPKNCYWASWKQQQNNKRNNHRVTWNGKTLTLTQWASELGVRRQTLVSRLTSYGWTIERTFTTPMAKM